MNLKCKHCSRPIVKLEGVITPTVGASTAKAIITCRNCTHYETVYVFNADGKVRDAYFQDKPKPKLTFEEKARAGQSSSKLERAASSSKREQLAT